MTDAIKMQLSAFVDGELSDAESELLIRRIGRDPELRELVAEYHAIGRIMRAEPEPAGMDALLGRVRAGIDADSGDDSVVTERPGRKAPSRQLAGFAVAAAVALVAILGVNQFAGFGEPGALTADGYTVPAPSEEEMPFFERHGEVTNDFNTRIVTLPLPRTDAQDTPAVEDDEATDEETLSVDE